MVMDTVKYYLIKDSYDTLEDDLTKLISFLSLTPGVKTSRDSENPNKITISYTFKGVTLNADIEVTGGQMAAGETRVAQPTVILSSQPIDNILPNLVKIGATPLGFRLFGQSLNSFIPGDPTLLDITTEIMVQKPSEILRAKNFKPIFAFRNSTAIYAENLTDNSIHFVNEYLLNYFIKFGLKEGEETPEFSYKVAPNLKRFVPLFDNNLVPMNFYHYYQKPAKIINQSWFDVDKPTRKIFIQPLLFELNEAKQSFEPVAPRGSAVLIADKIRPGEGLDAALKRYLNEQFQMTTDYIGAVVQRVIEFDRDREALLTPRLIVKVFVEKLENKEQFEDKAQRGWTSINEGQPQ